MNNSKNNKSGLSQHPANKANVVNIKMSFHPAARYLMTLQQAQPSIMLVAQTDLKLYSHLYNDGLLKALDYSFGHVILRHPQHFPAPFDVNGFVDLKKFKSMEVEYLTRTYNGIQIFVPNRFDAIFTSFWIDNVISQFQYNKLDNITEWLLPEVRYEDGEAKFWFKINPCYYKKRNIIEAINFMKVSNFPDNILNAIAVEADEFQSQFAPLKYIIENSQKYYQLGAIIDKLAYIDVQDEVNQLKPQIIEHNRKSVLKSVRTEKPKVSPAGWNILDKRGRYDGALDGYRINNETWKKAQFKQYDDQITNYVDQLKRSNLKNDKKSIELASNLIHSEFGMITRSKPIVSILAIKRAEIVKKVCDKIMEYLDTIEKFTPPEKWANDYGYSVANRKIVTTRLFPLSNDESPDSRFLEHSQIRYFLDNLIDNCTADPRIMIILEKINFSVIEINVSDEELQNMTNYVISRLINKNRSQYDRNRKYPLSNPEVFSLTRLAILCSYIMNQYTRFSLQVGKSDFSNYNSDFSPGSNVLMNEYLQACFRDPLGKIRADEPYKFCVLILLKHFNPLPTKINHIAQLLDLLFKCVLYPIGLTHEMLTDTYYKTSDFSNDKNAVVVQLIHLSDKSLSFENYVKNLILLFNVAKIHEKLHIKFCMTSEWKSEHIDEKITSQQLTEISDMILLCENEDQISQYLRYRKIARIASDYYKENRNEEDPILSKTILLLVDVPVKLIDAEIHTDSFRMEYRQFADDTYSIPRFNWVININKSILVGAYQPAHYKLRENETQLLNYFNSQSDQYTGCFGYQIYNMVLPYLAQEDKFRSVMVCKKMQKITNETIIRHELDYSGRNSVERLCSLFVYDNKYIGGKANKYLEYDEALESRKIEKIRNELLLMSGNIRITPKSKKKREFFCRMHDRLDDRILQYIQTTWNDNEDEYSFIN